MIDWRAWARAASAEMLPGGGCVLVFVSDNNFNPAQRTQFIAAHYQGMGDGEGHCSAPRSQP